MKKGDFIWGLIILTVITMIMAPFSKDVFIGVTKDHPYISGFIKFALLATLGEMLAVRIREGHFVKLSGLIYRGLIWGLLGLAITLVFVVFDAGVSGAMSNGFLPGKNSTLLRAFFISLTMNLIFAPTMMGFHKLTDAYIDLKYGQQIKKITVHQVVHYVDWDNFIGFVLFKTIPLFWIPAHTITFLLPSAYRVVVAALLSIALGIFLAISKTSKADQSLEVDV